MGQSQRPKVGIGVMIFKNGKVLIGKRKGPHGGGAWAWPGGHLEWMESVTDCARREAREETGVEITNVRFLRFMNFKNKDKTKHYADIAVIADWVSGEAKVLEPEKCEEWVWADPNNLPQPIWDTIPSYIEALRTGHTFFDA